MEGKNLSNVIPVLVDIPQMDELTAALEHHTRLTRQLVDSAYEIERLRLRVQATLSQYPTTIED